MKVITVLNQKGGAGKTTISTNVAACLSNRGFKVCLIDADFAQGSAMTWADINGDKYFDVVVKQANQIKSYAERNNGNYDYFIIDCPPRANNDSGLFVGASDLVLIPVQPSPYDIWACSELVEIIQSRKDASAGLPGTPKGGLPHASFVISRATKRSRIVGETLASLEDTGFGILKAMTTQYDAYKRAPIGGHTIFDTEERQQGPIDQIEAITTEIMEIVNDEC